MVELSQPFIPAEIPEDERSFDPVPRGRYPMQVIESRIDDTKAGTGRIMTLTLEIIDGEYTNRRIWDRLNIENQNPDAQRIALGSLRKLCDALGIVELRDTEELHFKPFEADVRIEEDKSGQYGPQNRVRYVSEGQAAPAPKSAPARPQAGRSGPSQGQQGRQPARPGPQAAKGGANKPWAKPGQRRGNGDEDIPF